MTAKPPSSAARYGRLALATAAGFVGGMLALVGGVWLVGTSPSLEKSPLAVAVPMGAFFLGVVGAARVVGGRLRPPEDAASTPRADETRTGEPSGPMASTSSPLDHLAPPEATANASETAMGHDALYKAALEALRAPQRQVGWQLAFGASFLFFVLARSDFGSPGRIATIVAVLFFHELGHLAAMRAFGYRDTRIFFVPFFGAAASGVREDARPWQRAVVLLAGPLPGIVAGIVWLVVCRTHPELPWYPGELLVWINAFNLLPLEPLDGGRLLNVLIFSRHRVVEIVFVACTSVALGIIGLALKAPALFIFVLLGAFYLPTRYRTGRAADIFRARWPTVPARLDGADDDWKRDLFRESLALASRVGAPKPELCATFMRRVHEASLTRPAPWPTAVLLFIVYVVSVGLSLVALALTVRPGAEDTDVSEAQPSAETIAASVSTLMFPPETTHTTRRPTSP